MSRRLYALHRWIAAVALLQLLIWTATGFLFAVLPGERVNGSPAPRAHEAPIPEGVAVVPPDQALRRASAAGVRGASKIELRGSPSGIYYLVRGEGGPLRIEARTGELAPVTLAEAEETARRDQPGRPAIESSALIERDALAEYRTKPLPAYRIMLADGRATAVYVDAKTGDVTARRSGAWRAFDFAYLIHTMDYGAEGELNNPLLVGVSSLGLLTVLSGLAVWCVRAVRFLKKKRAERTAPSAAIQE